MEQFEVVFKPIEGYEHVAVKGENGELIVQLVPKSSEEPQDKAKFFTQITAEDRKKVKRWLAKQKGKTDQENSFLTRVREAVEAVNYDYWIANLEPSVKSTGRRPSVIDGKIYYAEGNAVGVGFSCNNWAQMAKEYAPERASRLSNLHELFIWYALRIVNGLWTLDYVANDSSSVGNYRNAPGSAHSMEKTGARKCGGFYDGQGNSYKIVTCEGGYALVGGVYGNVGDDYPVADVDFGNFPDYFLCNGSGVLVLIK